MHIQLNFGHWFHLPGKSQYSVIMPIVLLNPQMLSTDLFNTVFLLLVI